MTTEEKLYSDIPPTKLRNKREKFKPAKTNKFWLMMASLFFFNMLQNRFYAFRYTGVENYTKRDSSAPTILFAPLTNVGCPTTSSLKYDGFTPRLSI